jgi:uracil-DNA glycosylase family 4
MGLIIKGYEPPRKKKKEPEPTEFKNPCELCPLKGHKQVVAEDYVRKPHPVMVIGAYPGIDEEEQGKPFVGISGELLHNILYNVGFTPEDLYETNVLMCRPGKEVPDEAVKACGAYLKAQIKDVQPSLIILCGDLPLQFFFNRKSITTVRGQVRIKGDYKFLMTFNAAHITREKEGSLDRRVFEQDLKHAYELYKGITRLTNKEYKLIRTLDEFEKAVDHLSHFDVLSADVESYAPEIKGSKEKTALDPYAEGFTIQSISLTGEENKAYCFLLEHPERIISLETTKEKLKALIENKAGKVGQSIKWDYKALAVHFGWHINNIIFDTEIASSLLDERRGIHNLDRLAMDWLGERSYKFEAHKIGREIMKAEDLCIRNCTDADYTLRLYPILKKRLEEENLYNYFMEQRIPAISALAKVEMNGLPVDLDYTVNLTKKYGEDIESTKAEIFKYPEVQSIEKFNINSNDHLKVLLFDKLGFEAGKKTKHGNYSTDKDVFEDLIKKYNHPVLSLIQDYAELQKFHGTYLWPVVMYHVKKDGKVHPTFTLHIASSGRLSCVNPNVQNVPVKSPERAKEIMDCYHAPEGFKIGLADYKGMELRVLAQYSKDPMLKYIFDNNIEPHQKTADECSKIAGEKLSRAQGKSLNFGIVYGETEFGLADSLGVDRKVAKSYLDSYLKVYRGVKEYQDRQKAFLRQYGYVTTLFGRKRWLKLTNDDRKNEGVYRRAINTPIQGTATDICLLALVLLQKIYEEAGFKSLLISTIHDAIMFQMHEDELESLKKFNIETMENIQLDFLTDVKLKVDWSEGNTWGDCK